jgi:membrane-bound metal-dependent hydrolase YbcI (DUF457 family)
MKFMEKYIECPDWWYGILLIISLALGLATALGYSSQLPCKSIFCMRYTQFIKRKLTHSLGWAFFVSNILAAFFVVGFPIRH